MRRLALLLGGLASVGPLSLDMYLPGLPQLSDDLGASASATQLTLTACLAGLALGQLLAGPLSDRLGRRRPVLVGATLFAAASLACALAPSVEALVALRFLQGLGGAAGIVVGRAIVRDLYEGDAAARLFSSLMLVGGIAPILAPIVGGVLLAVTDWRGVFVVLSLVAAALLAATARGLPESLAPRTDRRGGGTRAVLRDRRFVAYALCSGLMMGAMFAYIAGSPFVLQTIYGLSPQLYALVFAVNGLGIVVASYASRRLIGRATPAQLLCVGVALGAAGAVLLGAGIAVDAPVGVVLVALTLVVSSIGLVNPNATALALADHPADAGAASALLGTSQFLIGAAAAPLVGVAGAADALPMALTIAAAITLAVLALATTRVRVTDASSALNTV
ncbi:multidrug effflux MFS transporter [Solirubrobacter soli]|uniref:multidrug effflux MFS transporter n=1 Tax=Solirubrobacter soli TaxID=363832 RepID=UPI001FE05EDD|nr:multidrug effflux MFS transporter [Solirubrobacter soli]